MKTSNESGRHSMANPSLLQYQYSNRPPLSPSDNRTVFNPIDLAPGLAGVSALPWRLDVLLSYVGAAVMANRQMLLRHVLRRIKNPAEQIEFAEALIIAEAVADKASPLPSRLSLFGIRLYREFEPQMLMFWLCFPLWTNRELITPQFRTFLQDIMLSEALVIAEMYLDHEGVGTELDGTDQPTQLQRIAQKIKADGLLRRAL